MRISSRTFEVAKARNEIAMAIDGIASEYDLSDVEILQSINSYEATLLKYALRAERNPDNPDRPADVAHDED